MNMRGYWLVGLFFVFLSCSNSADINNEEAVMNDIQGAWIGCQNIGNVYRHFKLNVANNRFEGWVRISDSQNEPIWASDADEKGFISLSSLIDDTEKKIKYRKFAFTCSGRCCGDKSFTVKTFAEMIAYQEGKGLMVDGKIRMRKN